jgi:hypothetical protein
MLSIQSLRSPLTAKQGVDRAIELLKGFGFETTGWQDGKIQKAMVSLVGVFAADLTQIGRTLVEFGFNDFATGDALNEFSKSRYKNEKTAAVATAGPMTLTSVSSIPYTPEVGSLIASTDDGVQFRNTTSGTLSAGTPSAPTTLELQWKALIAGADGNVSSGAVTRLVTPLAGVTISNPGDPWYSTVGADEQSDAVIRQRNETKWARLTVELVAESYANIALDPEATGLTTVAKVKVDDQNPRGAGTIDVIVSAARAVLGDADMTTLQETFATHAFQTSSMWPADPASRVALLRPTEQALNIAATLYHDPNVASADVIAAAMQALRDFLDETPLGGWDYAPLSNVVTIGDLLQRLEDVDGIETVVMSSPSSTTSVGTLNLVVEGTFTLTAIAVTA